MHDCITEMREMLLIIEEPKMSVHSPNMLLIHEKGLLGAGLGGGFENVRALRPMKCKEAMKGSNKENG